MLELKLSIRTLQAILGGGAQIASEASRREKWGFAANSSYEKQAK